MTSTMDTDSRATVIIAEDDGGNRLALLAVLEPLGENVLAFETGEATLKYLLKNADCAAVILDVHMDGIGGFEVARLLRERERTRNIPVIFLTGTMLDSAIQGYAEGAVDFITKPFDAATLRSKVAALVRMHKARRALEHERDRSLRQVRTARAETEAERGYLYAFLEQVPALIARLRGPRHVFEFANTAYIEAIGNRDPVGKEAREALPELEGEPFFALLDQVFGSGIAHRANEVAVPLARGPDGAVETIYLNFVYQPTRNSEGVVDGIVR